MGHKTRVLLFSFVILSVIGLGVASYIGLKAGSGIKVESSVQDISDARPGSTMQKVRYTGTRDGVRLWVLEAVAATASKDKGSSVSIVHLDEVRLRHFTEGVVSSTVTGNEAFYDESSGDIRILGDVSVVSNDGSRLLTPSLTYSIAEAEASTTERVRLITTEMDVTGVGLRMDVRQGHISVLGDVTTVINGRFM